MVTICIGPVCVPLHLLFPFLVGLLHRYGWFKWFKQEWVTLRYWKSWWAGAPSKSAEIKAKPEVVKADKAVNDALQSDTPSGTNNTGPAASTPKKQHRQNNANDSTGLQQRSTGQKHAPDSHVI